MIDGDLLLRLYSTGCFPMWDPDEEEISVFRPDPRAVIEFDSFHVPRRLQSRMRSQPFDLKSDVAFEAVFDACHERRSDGSWMCPELRDGYLELFERGFAHSVEAWLDGNLVGGLYGVHIGAAFMAESKFSRPDQGGADASKICLVETVSHLISADFELLDVQFVNPHLEQFGICEIGAVEYDQRLQAALAHPRNWRTESGRFGGFS